MTLQKLKVAARQHEQREEWNAAIELYRQAIREAEGGSEGGDPALHNRIGDLAHKAGDDSAACDAWEQAASRYGEQGFVNDAIALCNKILRLDPSRLRTYHDLARFHARKRVIYDVRANLKTYFDRMTTEGRGDSARTALTKFGEEFPGWRDLEGLIDELLGRERAPEPAPQGTEGKGTPSGGGLVFLDTGPMTIERASDEATVSVEGVAIDPGIVGDLEIESAAEVAPLAGLELTTASDEGVRPTGGPGLEGLIAVERTSQEVTDAGSVEGLDRGERSDSGSVISAPIDGLESTALDVEKAKQSAEADLVYVASGEPLPEIPDSDPNDPLGQRVLAHALLEHGDRPGGIAALERALGLYQEKGEWLPAYQVAGDLIQAEPRAIGRYQARVEIGARMRDAGKLCDAYVELGSALVREGSAEKAIAVYRRVLELDPTDARARAALRTMGPDEATETPEGFVDFAAMVVDDAGPRTTRMRTETPEVALDEDETFRDALAEFKRALDKNLPIEDHQAHYDLGIAFKEMGLLDEAIGEFQKALRSPEGRLRTSEALGEVFFDQGKPAVAEAVLRSVEKGPEADADKIGVLYWLGRALETQGKGSDALAYYQRVLAVDVSFRDTTNRINQIDAGTTG